MIKSLIKKLAGSAGYKISSTKYVLKQFDADSHILKLDFDHVLSKYLIHDKPPGTDFIFIQVGAFDGVQCDPIIKYINKYDWRGVMLEPQPVPFGKLKERYNDNKRIAIRNAAISSSTGKTVLYTLDGDDLPSWSRGMASFSKENILRHNYIFPDINNRIKEIEVDTIPFEQLLREESISSLDLLQIDTEGYDAEIIKMFPFDKIKPKIIHFESKHIPKASLENVLDLLIGLDYKIARDREEDMMAVL